MVIIVLDRINPAVLFPKAYLVAMPVFYHNAQAGSMCVSGSVVFVHS